MIDSSLLEATLDGFWRSKKLKGKVHSWQINATSLFGLLTLFLALLVKRKFITLFYNVSSNEFPLYQYQNIAISIFFYFDLTTFLVFWFLHNVKVIMITPLPILYNMRVLVFNQNLRVIISMIIYPFYSFHHHLNHTII